MPESRRQLSPDDRRNELLALSTQIFGEHPYDEVRIDEIAERAGVSRALMYHYFPDKRTFFAAVVRAEGDRLFEATTGVIRDTTAAQRGIPINQLKASKVAAMRVHGRAGQSCPVCGDTIRDFAFASTTAQYCPTCQTGGAVLPG